MLALLYNAAVIVYAIYCIYIYYCFIDIMLLCCCLFQETSEFRSQCWSETITSVHNE